MKIAIYSHSIAPSIDGVCRRFTAILHELDRQGHETLLFTMEECPQDLPKRTKIVTLDYMIFPSYPDKKVARPTYRAIAKIYAGLRKFQPDVLHAVSDGYSQMFTLAGLFFGTPVVGSFHTDILDLLRTHNALGFQKLLVLTKERIDSFVFDSCATTSLSFKEKLRDQGVICEHVIQTAVDTTMFSPSKFNSELRRQLTFGDDKGFLCVYVGRISNEKRMDVIIEAMRGLRQGDGSQKAYLAIVGDGPSAGLYAKVHGKENGIYCQPRFLSHAELAEVYSSSDVHVSASEFETLGNTVLEAFACGIPVVVPKTQGFKDTVKDNVNGFLFEPGSSDSARKYIQLLKDDEVLRKKMGRDGRAAMSDRSISAVVADLLKWYARGTANRRRKGALRCFLSLLVVTPMIALTIFMFFWYDILVNYLLKKFISYAESSQSSHCSNEAVKAAPELDNKRLGSASDDVTCKNEDLLKHKIR